MPQQAPDTMSKVGNPGLPGRIRQYGLDPREYPAYWEGFCFAFVNTVETDRDADLTLADLCLHREERFPGKEHDEAFYQLCADYGVEQDKLTDLIRIARAIPYENRKPAWQRVSLTHMRAVSAQDIPLQKRVEFLDDVQRHGWNVTQLRQAVKDWRQATGKLFPSGSVQTFTVSMERGEGWERKLAQRIIDELSADELASFVDSLTVRLGTLRAVGVIPDPD